MVEHGKRPILLTEFGKVVYILEDFGHQSSFGGRNTAKISILQTLILAKRKCNSILRTR